MTTTTTVPVELKWDNGHTKEIEATPAGAHFAVHNSWRGDGPHNAPAWQIVHRTTGLVIPGRFYTPDAAHTAADEIGQLADWTGQDIDAVRLVASDCSAAASVVLREARDADRDAYFNGEAPAWPTHEADATGDRLARYYTYQAAHWGARTENLAGAFFGEDKPSDRDRTYIDVSVGYLNAWTTARLFRALLVYAPDRADEVARDVWNALEDGGAPGELLYDWLVEYRLDPKAASRLAGRP